MKNIKKFLVVISFFCMFLGLSSCEKPEEDKTRSYVSVEINPAVEIVLNGNDEVVTVNGLNDDGEMLIVDEKMIGKSINDVLTIIIEEAKACGYLTPITSEEINIETNNVKISINCTDSEHLSDLEDKIKTKVEKVISKEKIDAAYQQLESKKREYFEGVAKQYNPNLTNEILSKMTEEELMCYVELATIEKAELVSVELEKYYFSLKEYEFQIQYKEQIAKKLESLSSITSTVYTAAINALKMAVEQINKLQYDIFVSENSQYLKLLHELNSYKDKNMVLEYKMNFASSEDNKLEISTEIKTNDEMIKQIETQIISIMTLFNNNLEALKKIINSSISKLVEQEKNISNVNYNELLTSVEKKINDSKNGLLSEFEKEYTDEIINARTKMNQRKSALEAYVNE